MSTLRLLRWMYPQNTGSGFTFMLRPDTANTDIEQYFLQLAIKLKNFDVVINHDLPYLLHGYLKERLYRVQKLQLRVINRHMNEMERFSKILTETSDHSANSQLQNEVSLELNQMMNDLTEELQDLQAKARLINDLERRNFHYYDMSKHNLNKTNSIDTLERTLIRNHKNNRILCSNDLLNNNNQSKLKILLHQLTEELKTNSALNLIYADFSYTSFELHDLMVLPSDRNSSSPSLTRSLTETQTSFSSSSLPNNDVINILLLGETGIGKSTFINALVNYLTFNTLQEAQSNKPIVLIPISFLITTDDNFEEHVVEFGDFDPLNNEDFDYPGQTVTQHCQSYVFHLDHVHAEKLCIIDTPGFGDVRGVQQDNLQMQHILQHINNLTHLNAVCFLFKPNSARLNIFFQTCLTQLLELLGSNGHQNIIFCFTNARSTLYTPGNTPTLLRTMFDSLPIKDIPLNNENAFYFDNESFRYLIALQNGIQFDQDEKDEYESSWTSSVKELDRLLKYIRTRLNICPLQNECQSVQHAQMEINSMIRPILEAIRNTFRNRILSKIDTSNRSIKLCAQVIQRPSVFCTSCQRDAFQLSNFWILPDDTHEFRGKCLSCTCSANEHISADYILSYNVLKTLLNPEQNEMNDLLDRLCNASIDFAHFLIHVARSTKEDPFLTGLMRIIREEKQICTNHQPNQLNLQLIEELEQYIATYNEQMKTKETNENYKDLSLIYDKIKEVGKYPMICEQMGAIQKNKETPKVDQYEFEITKIQYVEKLSDEKLFK